jgi:hypothetical protein
LFPAFLFGQEDNQKNSSVELPSFVITGKDVISLPKLKKLPTGFISSVSEEYFKPAFTQDDFEITNIPDPGNNSFQSLDSVFYINGSLEGALGVNYRPYAKGNLSKQFNSGIFALNFLGFNKRAYVENSDQYLLAGGLGITLFTGDESPVLANAKINASADFSFHQYKLFASRLPETKRGLERGLFSLGINNPASRIFAYDYMFYNTIVRISDEKFYENVIGAKGYTRIKLDRFSLNGKAEILTQRLSGDSIPDRTYYEFKIRPYASIILASGLNLQGGFEFYNSDSGSVGNLFAAASLPLGMGISLFGEYAPTKEFTSYYGLSGVNRFFETRILRNYQLKKENAFKAFFKYEYGQYYEINGGAEYYSSDAHPFFYDEKNTGYFEIRNEKAASFSLFVNFLFHPGPFGFFYGDAKFSRTTNDDGNQLPFLPKLNMNLTYGNTIAEGIDGEIKIKYADMIYSDIANKEKLKQYIDVSLKGAYKFSAEFSFYGEINNLLNNKNYYWKGYQEDSFNLSMGINYKF